MVIVVGSSGFVGANLCDLMLKEKIPLLGLDKIQKDKSKVPFKKFDQINENLRSVANRAKTLILLSGVSSHSEVVKNRVYANRLNLISINELARAFIEIGGEHIIFASSEWVYTRLHSGVITTDPRFNPSPYGRHKLYGEILIQELCEAARVRFTNLRFGIIWGHRKSGSAIESITSSILDNRNSVQVSHMKTGRRFVHVEDVCRAITGAINERPVGTFDVQGKEIITLDKIIRSVIETAGIENIRVHELNSMPDTRYLSDNEIVELPYKWRIGDFSKDIRELIEKVHRI